MQPTESLSRDTVAVADTLTAMIKREQLTTTISSWHVGGYLDPFDPTVITADHRKKLVNWCYHFVDHCQFSRETVVSAMEMVDRFLSTASTSANISNSADADAATAVCEEALRDQSKFQLLTVAALYLSIKINEHVAVPSDLFAEMSNGAYSTDEIEAMERILLRGLSWRCHAPTAHQVGLSILSLILPFVDIPEDTWGFLIDEMKYLLELTVLNYDFSIQRTSTVALAAVHSALGELRCKCQQEKLRLYLSVIMECFYSDHSEQIINEVRRKMQSILIHEEEVGESILDEGSLDLEDSLKAFRRSISPSISFRDVMTSN